MRRDGVVVALLLTVAAGCELEEQVIAPQAPQLVVHAILDPGAPQQEVLVERTLTGVARPRNRTFDPRDPITSGGGLPVGGARVTISGPDGTFEGLEVRYVGTPPAYGAGRYLVRLGSETTPLLRGGTYELRVTTSDRAVVTGTTTIPAGPPAPASEAGSFNRDRETLRLVSPSVPGARSYGLRVESPYGTLLAFSDTASFQLAGDVRNPYSELLAKLFIPGFRQRAAIFAVDSNYYDYYRTRNDPFTGSGLVSRLRGGIGLFGSLVTLATREFEVTQDPREPAFEGEYVVGRFPGTSTPLVDVIRIYVETSGDRAALSGWHARQNGERLGMIGERAGTRVTLTLLTSQEAAEEYASFVGTFAGDSIVGQFGSRASGRAVLRRRRVP